MSSDTSTSNPRVRITDLEVLSDNWYTLRKATFEFQGFDGEWRSQQREAYDRGNGAAVLLCDPARGTIILTRQFERRPTSMVTPTECSSRYRPACWTATTRPLPMRRELEEETGHQVGELRELFDVYMSPGSVTERLAFF